MVQKKNKKIEILQAGDPILRQVSSAIPINKIKTAEIKKTITQLKSAIDSRLMPLQFLLCRLANQFVFLL